MNKLKQESGIKDEQENRELILRDELAIERTFLANERTLLAYLRSGVALVIAGVSIVHFSTEGWFWAIGFLSVPTGILTALVGVLRHNKMNGKIMSARTQKPVRGPENEPE